MKRQELLSEILKYLTYIQLQVGLSNALSFTDINKHAENFYRDLLNLAFDYNLVNINIEEPNAAAIDLGDEQISIAIQVTSTATLEKIKKTLKSFIKKNLDQKYDRLVVLNIKEKLNHRTKKLGDDGKFQIDLENDLWDVSTLLIKIGDQEISKIEQVLNFLKENINLVSIEKPSKEITTFIKLIAVLSEENQPLAGTGYKEEPDPEGKIDHRFSQHSAFIRQQYIDLYTEYGAVLADVLDASDLGHTKIRRLGLYLMEVSDTILQKHSGDAKVALDALVTMYAGMLAKLQVEYDQQAVRFFLVDQMIKCNVFPNKETVNA